MPGPQEESSIPEFPRGSRVGASKPTGLYASLGDILLDTENVFFHFDESTPMYVIDALDGMRAWVGSLASSGLRQIRSYGVPTAPGPRALEAALLWRETDAAPADLGRYEIRRFPLGHDVPLDEIGRPDRPPVLLIEVNGDQHEGERRLIRDVLSTVSRQLHVRVVLIASADHESAVFADALARDGIVVLIVVPGDRADWADNFGSGTSFPHIRREQVSVVDKLARSARKRRRARGLAEVVAAADAEREQRRAQKEEEARAADAADLQRQEAETGVDLAAIGAYLDAMTRVDWDRARLRRIGSRDWLLALGDDDGMRSAGAQWETHLTASTLAARDDTPVELEVAHRVDGFLLLSVLFAEHAPDFETRRIVNRFVGDRILSVPELAVFTNALAEIRRGFLRPGG